MYSYHDIVLLTICLFINFSFGDLHVAVWPIVLVHRGINKGNNACVSTTACADSYVDGGSPVQ